MCQMNFYDKLLDYRKSITKIPTTDINFFRRLLALEEYLAHYMPFRSFYF